MRRAYLLHIEAPESIKNNTSRGEEVIQLNLTLHIFTYEAALLIANR